MLILVEVFKHSHVPHLNNGDEHTHKSETLERDLDISEGKSDSSCV